MDEWEYNRRVKNLSNWLDTHPHDEEVKEHGQCKYCKKHLDELMEGMKLFSYIMLGITALVLIIIGWSAGITFALELVGVGGLLYVGLRLYRRYVGWSCF